MAASRAGGTRMNSGAACTTSTLRNGMANARTATLLGPGMTAIKRGIRKTALKRTTMGGLEANGSGM